MGNVVGYGKWPVRHYWLAILAVFGCMGLVCTAYGALDEYYDAANSAQALVVRAAPEARTDLAGEIRAALRWRDGLGDNLVVLTRTKAQRAQYGVSVFLYAGHYLDRRQTSAATQTIGFRPRLPRGLELGFFATILNPDGFRPRQY